MAVSLVVKEPTGFLALKKYVSALTCTFSTMTQKQESAYLAIFLAWDVWVPRPNSVLTVGLMKSENEFLTAKSRN